MSSSVPAGGSLALWSLRGVVAFLIVLGLIVATARGFSLYRGMSLDRPPGELSGFDRQSTEVLRLLIGIEGGSARSIELEQQSTEMLGKFSRHPAATLLHVAPSALFLLLIPFQFSSRSRQRSLRAHRWRGRATVLLAIPIGLSGLFFGLVMPFGGTIEATAIGVFGAWFLFALARGYIAILRRRIAQHREWMIRMVAVALGVSVQRVIAGILAMTTGDLPREWFGLSVWIGLGLSSLVAESWIQHTRRERWRVKSEG